MNTTVHHPLFARFYARFSGVVEAAGVAQHRDELLADLHGRVIEVGAGNGLNFAHYPATVTEVVAVEPEPYLRARAAEAARSAPVAVRVVAGTAESLPAKEAEFDAGVASLVLCSVSDPALALGELRRAIRPEGELRFYEHICSSDPRFACFQRTVDLVWPHLGGGCHTARPTDRTIKEAGFVVSRQRHFTFRPSIVAAPVSPHVIGVAVRR